MEGLLSEEEKTNLVLDHKRIIYYMANRYRFIENDFDEAIGWCYLGMANAIAEYQQDTSEEFSDIAFREISKVLKNAYFKTSQRYEYSSLDEPVKGYDDLTLGDSLTTESDFYDAQDIYRMIDEALFEEEIESKEMLLDYLIEEISMNEISDKRNHRLPYVRRVIRRSIELLRLYLLNNDIISEYLLYPSTEGHKIKEYKPLDNIDRGRIKYLNKAYPFLRAYDLGIILNIDAQSIATVVDYPTSSYVRAIPDETIEKQAIEYCKQNYYERLPGELVVYNISEGLMI